MTEQAELIAEFKGKRIGVLMGGMSEEREISFKSGRAVLAALLSRGYNAVEIDAVSNVAAELKSLDVEIAFIALHGLYGEDGAIQGLLEIMRIPYTGAGVLASAVTMDKVASKVVFDQHQISTPRSFVLKDGNAVIPDGFELPLIVKPASHGSTIGIGVADTIEEFKTAVTEAYKLEEVLIVEEFINGREITISIIEDRVLPIVEIITNARIYDFDSKYKKGLTEFVVPAKLDKAVAERAGEVAVKTYRALGCAGAARVDILLDAAGELFVLEANTIPGMTGMSLLPMAASAAGSSYEELVEEILLTARLHKATG